MPPNHLLKHRPLITPRIEFQPMPRAPLPKITPRIEFDPERVASPRRRFEEDGMAKIESAKRRRLMTSDRQGDAEGSGGISDPSSTILRVPGLGLIPKPAGEPGRPGSGGFALEDTLIRDHNWLQKEMDDLNVCTPL